MENYFGIIEIDRVDNEQAGPVAAVDFIPLAIDHTRFVHYPDCQQLIIWLTYPGSEYGNIRLVDTNTGKTVDEYSVADKLNGSIQLVWDTLASHQALIPLRSGGRMDGSIISILLNTKKEICQKGKW